MNDQIIKDRCWTPWIIGGSGLSVGLIFGVLLLSSLIVPSRATSSMANSQPVIFVTLSPTVNIPRLNSELSSTLTDTVSLKPTTPTVTSAISDGDAEPSPSL